jgi:hypothetical protein
MHEAPRNGDWAARALGERARPKGTSTAWNAEHTPRLPLLLRKVSHGHNPETELLVCHSPTNASRCPHTIASVRLVMLVHGVHAMHAVFLPATLQECEPLDPLDSTWRLHPGGAIAAPQPQRTAIQGGVGHHTRSSSAPSAEGANRPTSHGKVLQDEPKCLVHYHITLCCQAVLLEAATAPGLLRLFPWLPR